MSTLTEKLKSLVYPQGKSSTEALPKRLFELNSEVKGLGSKVIRSFVNSLKEGNFDPNRVDFDDYKLEGFNLDKLPRDSLVVLEYPDQNFLFTYSPDLGFFGYTPKLYRQRDGKYVDLHRIPNKQMIEKAKNTWVIPLSEFGDRDEFKRKMEARKANSSDPNRRYTGKDLEEKKRSYWWVDRDQRDQLFDKSGYLIDREALQERLKAYRAKKIESGGIDSIRSKLDELAKKYNDQTAEVLGDYQKYMMIDGSEDVDGSIQRYFEDYLQTAWGYRREFQYLVNSITEFSEKIEKFSDEERNKYLGVYSKNLSDNISTLEKGYIGNKLKKAYDRLQVELKKQLELKNQVGATEGLRGQSYTRALLATEGYFVKSHLRKVAKENLEDLGDDWSDERKSATEEDEDDDSPFRIPGWPEPDSKDLYRAAAAGDDPAKIATQLKLIKDVNKMKRRLQAFFDESPNLTKTAIRRIGLYAFPEPLKSIVRQAYDESEKRDNS